MPSLKGTETEQNLKNVFAGEIQAIRRYLYFAQKAEVGPQRRRRRVPLDCRGRDWPCSRASRISRGSGRPGDRQADGLTGDNLKAAIASETHEYTDMYPGMARAARQEGFDEIADWFETLAKAGKSHTGRFQKALDAL